MASLWGSAAGHRNARGRTVMGWFGFSFKERGKYTIAFSRCFGCEHFDGAEGDYARCKLGIEHRMDLRCPRMTPGDGATCTGCYFREPGRDYCRALDRKPEFRTFCPEHGAIL